MTLAHSRTLRTPLITIRQFKVSKMFNSSTIRQMVDEVIRDHDLPYQPQRFFELPDSSWTWCCELSDPGAPEPDRTFDVCVRWPWGSDYESVKAELTRQLVGRFKS
jgi:hypothetical protein